MQEPFRTPACNTLRDFETLHIIVPRGTTPDRARQGPFRLIRSPSSAAWSVCLPLLTARHLTPDPARAASAARLARTFPIEAAAHADRRGCRPERSDRRSGLVGARRGASSGGLSWGRSASATPSWADRVFSFPIPGAATFAFALTTRVRAWSTSSVSRLRILDSRIYSAALDAALIRASFSAGPTRTESCARGEAQGAETRKRALRAARDTSRDEMDRRRYCRSARPPARQARAAW
jgi:hypothetical protein